MRRHLKRKPGAGNKTIYVRNPDAWRRAEELARQMEISVSELIERAILEYNPA